MFIVKNPSAIATRYVAGIRLNAAEYLMLPFSQAARTDLAKTGTQTEFVQWMSPYGDIIEVSESETDYGKYDFCVNDSLVGQSLKADQLIRLVAAVENNRPLLAWKAFKGLPTGNHIPMSVKIGFVYQQERNYVMVSVGRLSPLHILELEDMQWETVDEIVIDTPGDKPVRITANHGFAVAPVLVGDKPMTVDELIGELAAKKVRAWTFYDLPKANAEPTGGFRNRR